MVAMVLLLIICLSSAYFFAIPPFRKEALRFAALERAAGVMDFVVAVRRLPILVGEDQTGYYELSDFPLTGGSSECHFPFSLTPVTNRFIFADSPNTNRMPSVWYTLHVTVPQVGEVIPLAATEMLSAELKLYGKPGDTNSLFATFKMILPPGS